MVGSNDDLALAVPLTIIADYAALFAIMLLITMFIHCLYELRRTNFSMQSSLRCSTIQHNIIMMELVMIFFFILSSISSAFIFNDYFTKIGSDSYTKPFCGIGYLLFIIGYNYGKIFYISLFIYRIYISFRNTSFTLNTKCVFFMVIFYVFIAFTFGLFFIVRIGLLHDYMIYKTATFNLCTPIFYDPTWQSMSSYIQITFACTELIVSIYTLCAFVRRIQKLRREITELDINDTTKTQENKIKAQKLKSIATKQMVLALIAILSTQCLLISSAMTGFAIIMVPFDIIINTASVHLMHPFTETLCCKHNNPFCCNNQHNISAMARNQQIQQQHVEQQQDQARSNERKTKLSTNTSDLEQSSTSISTPQHKPKLHIITKSEHSSGSVPRAYLQTTQQHIIEMEQIR